MEIDTRRKASLALAEARSLHEEAVRLYYHECYSEAVPLAEAALAGFAALQLFEHYDVAYCSNTLGTLYYKQGQFQKALELHERAVTINEKLFGWYNLNVAACANNLAMDYKALAQYSEAEQLYDRVLPVYEEMLGSDNPRKADLLVNKALLNVAQGSTTHACALLNEALDIRERVFGAYDLRVANVLTLCALSHSDIGDYARSADFLTRAQAVCDHDTNSSGGPGLADTLCNLAQAYLAHGDYSQPARLLTQAFEILELEFGAGSPAVAQVAASLGSLYQARGDRDRAEMHYKQVLDIHARSLGPLHSDVATAMNNLAVLYLETGAHEAAERLSEQSLALREQQFGPDSIAAASSLNTLAGVYQSQKQYDRARPYLERSLRIREDAFGANHPDVATSLTNLAGNYKHAGDLETAELLYLRAVAIDEATLGPSHPHFASDLLSTADVYWRRGAIALSLNFLQRSSDAREQELIVNLTIGSERQKLEYLELTASEQDIAVTLCTSTNAQAATLAIGRRIGLECVLRRKGRSLDVMANSIDAFRRAELPEGLEVLDALAEAQVALSTLALRGPGKLSIDEYANEVRAWEDRTELLESRLSESGSRLRVSLSPVTVDGVSRLVPDKAWLIEFVEFRPYRADHEAFGPSRYGAFLLNRGGDVEWVDLGDAKEIDRAVDEFRTALQDPSIDIEWVLKPIAHALYKVLLQPFRGLVGSDRQLLLAPDGILNLLPFEALVDERGVYLVEEFELSYLTSGRDLLRMVGRNNSRGVPAIVADPDFESLPVGCASSVDLAASAIRQADFIFPDGMTFERLPGCAAEGVAIVRLLPRATLLMGVDASIAALKRMAGPQVLHIATHGYFFEAAEEPEATAPGLIRRESLSEDHLGVAMRGRPLRGDALLRSGLALAGANHYVETGTGLLTALEASGLDLWGTKLVVLSACDTGVGAFKAGAGVYGLRRSLVLAGSETQVMSLWPVSDEATQELMISFYELLISGEGRGSALRSVKRRMLRKTTMQHPYYWASFIVIGNWTSVDGLGT